MINPFHLSISLGSVFGEGARKLLGAPDLGIYDVLVRECAQNSWDARLEGKRPSFRFDVRRLQERSKRTLSEEFFNASDAVTSQIRSWVLSNEQPWVVEISDRNTSGLNGLTNPSESPRPGQETNFRDLVYVYGASRDTDLGGGTYGFGKTASYLASQLNTVIYWTRCWHEGELEYRLIASRMGDKFDIDGTLYTGRSWWGVTGGTEDCAPLVGEEAKRLGELIFASHFTGDETGTSVLILAPAIEEDQQEQDDSSLQLQMKGIATTVRDATLVNLWPKLTPAPGSDNAPMDFSISFDNEVVDLGSPSTGLWKIWAAALNAVRTGKESSDPWVTTTFKDISYRRSARGSGGLKHLGNAAVGFTLPLNDQQAFDRLFATRNGMICRMRSAELVVDYQEIPRASEIPGGYFVGVFKVAAERRVDEAFAEAESPTHSSWQTETLKPIHKSPVLYALRMVDDFAKRQVEEKLGGTSDPDARMSEAISSGLKHLRPVALRVSSDAPSPKRTRGRKRRILKPTIESIEFVGSSGGKQTQRVIVRTPKSDSQVPVQMNVTLQGDVQSFPLGDGAVECEWLSIDDSSRFDGLSALLSPDATYQVDVTCRGTYALNFELKAVEQ